MTIEGSRKLARVADTVSDTGTVIDVRDYQVRLRSFFGRRARGHWDVDDLVQESLARFLVVCRRTVVAQPYGYIFRIANNLLVDRSRFDAIAHANLENGSGDEMDWPGVQPEQENRRRHDDLRMALDQALDELPDKCRDAFVLKRFHDLDTPTISRRLNISERMVQKHLVRATTHLHHRLIVSEETHS